MENQAFRPLTDEEKMSHFPSGVLASGEALFYDTRQTAPINETYPDPSGFISESGIYATYAKNDGGVPLESGLFSMNGLVSHFSNRGITDFSIFNPYIHYYSVEQPSGTVVPYPVGTGQPDTHKPIAIGYGFGIQSKGEHQYSLYPTGDGGTYLRSDRETWDVETSGYAVPAQPNWPPEGGEHSGTGSGVAK